MAIVVSKDMGLTHRDFYRMFATVAGDCAWHVEGDVVTLDHPVGLVKIYLGPERLRTIARMSLPATTLRFEFVQHDQSEVDAFMQRFDLSFRRGGG